MPEPPATTRQLTAPVAALRAAMPEAELAFGDRVDKKTPVRFLARTGDPIDHWYWGRLVHDFAGMTHKDVIPLDYCHDPDEVLGYVDEFDAGTDLRVAGQFVHFTETDRASEIAHKRPQGVPYQASITFYALEPGDTVVEFVPEGVAVQVNGRQLDGPLTVFRKWPLRGLAVCPYGGDPNTETELAASDAERCPITILNANPETMPQPLAAQLTPPAASTPAGQTDSQLAAGQDAPTTPAATDGNAAGSEAQLTDDQAGDDQAGNDAGQELAAGDGQEAGQQPAGQTEDRQLSAADLSAWSQEFGSENAIRWLTAGVPLAEARQQHAQQLQAQLAAERQTNQQLQQRLDAARTGEETELSGDLEGSTDQQPNSQLANAVGPNVARLAAGMKLAGAAPAAK